MDAVTTLPRSRPLTRADLDAMPDDGHRYELIDGALIVTPAPAPLHQFAVGNIYGWLRAAQPDDTYAVAVAPFDVALTDDTVMQPDILVARTIDVTNRGLPKAPLLAVEVLSPSTKHIDLMLKRSRFEVAGCQSYWVVDPREYTLTAWTMTDGRYTDAVTASDDTVFHADLPFPVDIPLAEITYPVPRP